MILQAMDKYRAELEERVTASKLRAPQSLDSKIQGAASAPSVRTAYRWLDLRPSFPKRYVLARITRVEARAHRIDDYVRQTIKGEMRPDVAPVAIDAEKWQAACENRRRYCEKVAQEMDCRDDPGDNV